MNYISTRGGMAPQPFSDILLEGLAPDGGLAVPEQLPQISAETLESWRGLPYADLAFEVLSRFATDIPVEDLRRLTRAAYTPQIFNSEDIVPLRPLNDGLSLLGLSEGPTLAFKDMAMQFLGQVFEYVLTQRGTTLNIVGATSGDTGSAAEYALRGKHGVAVFMLSPHGRMSAFQRAQMYSLQDENIHNIAVRGVFDEAQDIVKALAGDLAFKAKYRLGAVNSINWARIAAQVVYYFHGWLRATDKPGQQVSFTVPSGNFGNILSGHIARGMGLPVRRLVLATNENNVLEEFFRTGIYRPRPAEQTYATSSPSMDISRASNFERFVFDLVGRDADRVKALWADMARDGFFDLSALKPQFEAQYGFVSGASSHEDRLATIRSLYDETGVLVDPHTADGVKVAREHVEPGVPMLVLETALPAKFSETIEAALGRPATPPGNLANLESLPQRVEVMDCDAAAVRRYIEAHAKV
ncbi:threonine synthase [Achromobacter ruhlandii]|uniref:Threonine synthase n=1 Tax=Achromobacter ruhlandii TaxID=72557 RepID=A0ABM8M168_9BURK|nr:threonine synthase [Achromobacter ruhlandii]AKP89169.1 Threonine synthase [Achromobacter xylosoxidans]AOU92012.1 threonine synthase [Achromobacter ruhlandii]MCZ8432407.1 threonine synthase [Achromobacter ruhlandii]MDC6087192.1 threonine synthase [Achromobacter ruhlandii]MDC6151744.1 threonine synthase [Achromobacter ruhlandii]